MVRFLLDIHEILEKMCITKWDFPRVMMSLFNNSAPMCGRRRTKEIEREQGKNLNLEFCES